MHHGVDCSRDVLVHGRQRPVAHLLQHQRRQALERVDGAVGMHGGQRTVVAGVERLQQVHGLVAADLADHQPVGAHAQRGAQQVRQGDLANTVRCGVAGFQPHDVLVSEAQLGHIFQCDQPCVWLDLAGKRVEQCGLARRGCAADQQVAAAVHQLAQQVAHGRAGESRQRHRLRAEAADGEARPVDGNRRHHRAQPRPVGEACIDGGMRAVESPADGGEDVLDDAEQRAGPDVADALQLPAALDPHIGAAVHHHFVDGGVAQPTFQPTQRCLLGDEVDHAALFNE